MQAIIFAAGNGEKLKRITGNGAKCLVTVNGETLIERLIRQLTENGITDIAIVAGYGKDALKETVSRLNLSAQISYIDNDEFDTTGSLFSLYLARDLLKKGDTLILPGNVIFDAGLLDHCVTQEPANRVFVDRYKSWMTGYTVKRTDGRISALSKEPDYGSLTTDFKTAGIYFLTKTFIENDLLPALEKDGLKKEESIESLWTTDLIRAADLQPESLEARKWFEINDIQDLDLASVLFSEDEEQVTAAMLGRWGGYWRYPDYLDYFYLVTPYYPTAALKEELKANFDPLLEQYPSGMKAEALLAAKEFDVEPENIVIGNGAAELIKSIMERITGRTGFIRPSFEEYPNRFVSESIKMQVETENFNYGYDDITAFFGDKNLDNLVVVNPDNPSGNYIPKADMLRLCQWTKERNIRLIVDESFVDFADEKNSTLIDQGILDAYPNLYVIKSISKSYGIPGLRLGVLAGGDREMIAFMKKDVAIWNINSFAEFYMQICGKYKKDYENALEKIRSERAVFQAELEKLPFLRVIPSQANYVMVELLCGLSAETLKKKMLIEKKVFIKTLGKKIGGTRQYLRIAIRTREDNEAFIVKLKEIVDEMKAL